MTGKGFEMIDLHANILPGLDDGAESLEDSIEMCWISYQDGVRTIVATPHILPGVYDNHRSTILARTRELNEAILKFGVGSSEHEVKQPFVILPGADVHFSPNLPQLCENGEIVTVNNEGRSLMLEFDFMTLPYQGEEVLFQLIARGITPVITHPERTLEIARAPRRYYEMIKMGCLGQVTAMSLTGGFGAEVKRVAGRLLSHRLVHFIASDAHSAHRRPPLLSPAVKEAEKVVGREEARKMVTEHPRALLEGRRPDVPEPIPI
jgi:protein-tyrosine phosphatase